MIVKVYRRGAGVRLPRCGHCRTEVEALEVSEDVFLNRIRLVAKCHGDFESVALPLEGLGSLDFGQGEAFAERLLAAPAP